MSQHLLSTAMIPVFLNETGTFQHLEGAAFVNENTSAAPVGGAGKGMLLKGVGMLSPKAVMLAALAQFVKENRPTTRRGLLLAKRTVNGS